MPHAPFDPSKAITFDLAHGQVRLDETPPRALVPAEALAALANAAGREASEAFAKALGEPLGQRVARRLGGSADKAREASVDEVVDHLGGELALAGLGSLSLERWGRAVVLVVDQSPLLGAGEGLLAAILSSALRGATGRDARCAPLMREGVRTRFLVASEKAAERAQGWLKDGASWGDVLARLHTPSNETRGNA